MHLPPLAPSRRALVRAAWAAPLITVAASAPAAAATSQAPYLTFDPTTTRVAPTGQLNGWYYLHLGAGSTITPVGADIFGNDLVLTLTFTRKSDNAALNLGVFSGVPAAGWSRYPNTVVTQPTYLYQPGALDGSSVPVGMASDAVLVSTRVNAQSVAGTLTMVFSATARDGRLFSPTGLTFDIPPTG